MDELAKIKPFSDSGSKPDLNEQSFIQGDATQAVVVP